MKLDEMNNLNRQIEEGVETEAYLHKMEQQKSQPLNLGPATLVATICCLLIGWLFNIPAVTWVGLALYLFMTYMTVREDTKLFLIYAAYATVGHVVVGVVSYFQPEGMQITFGQWFFSGSILWYGGASILYNLVYIFLGDV